MNNNIIISVIITTYNKPTYLKSVLLGFELQNNRNFEIIIADDGSNDETKQLIESFSATSWMKIKQVWHEDKGFRKCTILNKAILASETDYLLFTDDDCIPRPDFIDVHIKNAEKGRFLSGGYFKLNEVITAKVTPDDIIRQHVFNIKWLVKNGQTMNFKLSKLSKCSAYTSFLNKFTTTKPTWNGHNVSGWKEDIMAVNGYNEDMMYGGLDRELGERLENFGVHGKQIRYQAIVVHLDHGRPYRKKDLMDKNRAIRDAVKKQKIVWAENGLNQHR
ncbi:MAG: glycosyltransferase family 2 protein [Mangrovibacterium sp.]